MENVIWRGRDTQLPQVERSPWALLRIEITALYHHGHVAAWPWVDYSSF